jgi:HK97 family phage portal protein
VSVYRLLAKEETAGQREDRMFWSGADFSGWSLALASGVRVDADSAMTSSTVWRCVNIIASAVGVLPLLTYRRLEHGKERAMDHRVATLLRTRPNPLMDAMTFKSVLTAHLLLWGNTYAEIVQDATGTPVELWPLPPWRVQPRITGARSIEYGIKRDGIVIGALGPEQVLHFRGLGGDGITGYSVIRYAAESVGAALAAEKFGAAFFGNGARPGGVLEHPGQLGEAAAKNLRDHWERMHQGLDQAQRVAVLEEGMKYQAVGVPPEEAQFLETRQFDREEVANWFGVPAYMLNSDNKPTYASVEQKNIDFVAYTLQPWLTRWEMECGYKLFTEEERAGYFVEFKTEALERGDKKSRYEGYRIALGRAGEPRWMEPNEIREAENLNPIEGLDDQKPASAAAPPPALPANDADLQARAALLPPVQSALSRLAGRETKALTRKARGEAPEKFAALAAEFYAEHRDLLTDALAPLSEAFVAWTQRPARPEALAGFAADYCRSACAGACGAHVAGALDAWLSRHAAEVPAAALRFLGAIGSADHA